MQAASAAIRLVEQVRSRIRAQRALDWAVAWGAIGAAVAIFVQIACALLESPPGPWPVIVALALPVCFGVLGAAMPLSPLVAAQRIDMSHQLPDTVASAWSFSERATSDRSEFERACIRQAEVAAQGIELRRVSPWTWPRYTLHWALALAALTSVVYMPTPSGSGPHTSVSPPLVNPQRTLMDAEQLHAFQRSITLLDQNASTPAAKHAVDEVNRLLERMADGSIDRETALRELQRLDAQLQAAAPAHPEALRDAMASLSTPLQPAATTRTLARALEQTDPRAAALEMQAIAKAVRDGNLRQRDLTQLRTALARAAKARPGPTSTELRAQVEQQQRLLQRQHEQAAQTSTPRERRLLQQRQRELERLQRDEQQATEHERQLERLQRELDEAAKDLGSDQPADASEALERAAEDLNRMANEQLSEQQRQQLRQQIQQLREELRRQRSQQQQAGSDRGQQQSSASGGMQRLQLDRFARLAQGQSQASGKAPGEPNSGQPGSGQPDGASRTNNGDTRALTLTPGQGGSGQQVRVELPTSRRTATPRSTGTGSGQGEGGAPPTMGAPTSLDAQHVDTRVHGQAQDGPSRSQVIAGASHEGFASRDYERTYVEYERHAQSVIERDEIPTGYRFYVRRYFQLIRPRETNNE